MQDEDDRILKTASAISQLRAADADVTKAEQTLENAKKVQAQRKKALDDLKRGSSESRKATS